MFMAANPSVFAEMRKASLTLPCKRATKEERKMARFSFLQNAKTITLFNTDRKWHTTTGITRQQQKWEAGNNNHVYATQQTFFLRYGKA
jgi:hypothetical protein